MAYKTQYHLKGKHQSGRAVRVQELDDPDRVLIDAAKLVGKDATGIELKKLEWRNGLKEFVVEVSEPCEDPMTAKWTKVSHADLDDLKRFFTAKDIRILETLYREFHEVSDQELEAIAGKALPVSEG